MGLVVWLAGGWPCAGSSRAHPIEAPRQPQVESRELILPVRRMLRTWLTKAASKLRVSIAKC